MNDPQEEERITARALRASWVATRGLESWMITTTKGDIVGDVYTEELANHIVEHHNFQVQTWMSAERIPRVDE